MARLGPSSSRCRDMVGEPFALLNAVIAGAVFSDGRLRCEHDMQLEDPGVRVGLAAAGERCIIAARTPISCCGDLEPFSHIAPPQTRPRS